jgi:hypothetical protein
MEGGWSKKEQPSRCNRGENKQKLTACDRGKPYLDSLKQIGKRKQETISDSERMFLLSLFPAIQQLFPFLSRETLQRKLRRSAAPEFQLITYQSTLLASPLALSECSSNTQISLVDYTATSQASYHRFRKCCYTDWVIRSTCTCTQRLIHLTICERIVSAPE